jgi:uncharacterized Zn-binding protein involved in type VI secretion
MASKVALTAVSTAGGGQLFTSPNTTVVIENHYAAVVGTKVASHGTAPHNASVTTQGISTITIEGKALNKEGDLTTCAHPIVGGASNVFCG